MPPTKNVDSADAAAPRRSGRISAQARIQTAPTTKNNAKKRAAATGPGEDTANTESNKKARSNAKSVDVEEEKDKPEPLAPIDVGGALPTLTLKNEKDEDIQVADLASEKGVVMFLVPKADTPGCTNQACGFRDIYEEFSTLDYDVYCLSADTPSAQVKWQTKKELPYHLLSDRNRVLIGALGAAEGNKTKRSHFVFEKGGKLVDKKIPVKPNDSPKLALEFIKGQASN
ncbi:AhpC-TSA-domain-containing protein [Amanita rubescens]|nr:AhpC-TSA-domain-containing protein [Amanita rubescens]